jgi:prepilin-type N-terminal cleavage/methylation domain-containing protein
MPIQKNEKGFTLIEVLIVVAIIGILAVLLIPNAITAIQKTKQKSTMKDIVSMATAAMDYTHDQGTWNISQTGDLAENNEFILAISPMYIKICPVVDHWGNPYKVYVGAAAAVRSIDDTELGPEDFVIESYGRDGISDGWAYNPADTSGDYYTVDSMLAFKWDLVNWNGGWIRAPLVAVSPGN